MNKRLIVGIVVIVLAILGGVYYFFNNKSAPNTSAPLATASAQNTITLTQNGFSPSTLTIKVGTTVTWINKSGTQATVNSNPHPIHTDYPPLNLGSFSNGAILSLIFNKAGTYGYHNHLNPGQTGTIIVQ